MIRGALSDNFKGTGCFVSLSRLRIIIEIILICAALSDAIKGSGDSTSASTTERSTTFDKTTDVTTDGPMVTTTTLHETSTSAIASTTGKI